MRFLLSALLASACTFGADATGRGVLKSEYLDLMEAAVSAYSDDHIERYIAEVEREGVQEHGFPRLAANIGILVANGRIPAKRDAFRRMMSICCREAARGPMKIEGNEFSVKELVLALDAAERAGIFDRAGFACEREDGRGGTVSKINTSRQ